MTLPHPHGNASGEIAHNSSYDTGVTPGSTGGKFIGFGEQGTSAFANRAHWALSENVDYVYQIIAADRAIPAADAFTIAGGGENNHQIMDDVWVGDGGYPASATEGLQLLFNVLDDQYNELLDVAGNEVVVAIVRDSTDTTDEYKDGFENNPWVTFKTIDSDGADVTNPYTIPATTEVRLMYGSKGSLENLSTDALTRFKVQSGDEAPAGVFRTDGTTPMMGNADWDGYNINNIGDLVGKTGQDVLLRSMQDLNLQDQYAGPIPFSESGQSSLLGTLNTSLLGSINSDAQHIRGLFGNRTLVKGGAIVMTGATGLVTLPAGMIVSVNGEAVNVGGQNYTAGTSAAWGVIDATGTFVERTTTPLATDAPVAYHNWNGVDTFTTEYDIRWVANGIASTMRMTVSNTHPDADFTDLKIAFDIIRVMNLSNSPVSYVVEIIDKIDWTQELYLPIGVPITLRGGGHLDTGQPMIDVNVPPATNVLNCFGSTVRIENLIFRQTNATAHTATIILNPGTGSVFKNVHFKSYTGKWNDGIVWDTSTRSNMLIDECFFGQLQGTAVDTSGATAVTNVMIRRCDVESTNETPIGFNLPHERNIIEDCRLGGVQSPSDAIADIGIILGPNSSVRNTSIVCATSVSDVGIRLYSTPTITGLMGTDVHYEIRGCQFKQCLYAVESQFTTAGARNPHVVFEGNTVKWCAHGVYVANSLSAIGDGVSYKIVNNKFVLAASVKASIHLDTAMNVTVSGNHFVDCDGTPIRLIQHNRASIVGNVFESYRLGPSGDYAIEVLDSDSDDEEVIIQGNIFTGNGASTAPTAIYVDANNVTIDGNHFGTDVTGLEVGVHMVSGVRNKITNNNFRRVIDKSIYVNMSAESEPDGYVLISGNIFNPPNHALGVASVYIAGTPGCRVINNRFVGDRGDSNQAGRAIYINDLVRDVRETVVSNNEFRDVIGTPSAGTEYRVVWIEGDSAGERANGIVVADNYFAECGYSGASAVASRIIEVEGDGYKVCGNVIKDSHGPQNASGTQELIFATGVALDHATINDNLILEDSITSAGRITLGDWVGIKTSSLTSTICQNEYYTIDHGTVISHNGASEYFIAIGAYSTVHSNVMSLRTRTTVTTQKFINVTGGYPHAIGNVCYSSSYDMDFGVGDQAVLIGNYAGGAITQTGEEIVAVGNSSFNGITFSGGGTTPGLVMGNIVYGAGTTNAGSHNTSGNL